MKLLAPAGNLESLKVAVYHGADEVYLGINQFNARNNIDGFTLDSLKEAVLFAHAYNVKVLLAVNILFSNEEMQSALDLIVDAFNLGVDAFIVQDIGLISLLYKNFPEIPVHASTQMGIHNLEGVREIEKLGVKRVVLARETPLSEIKRIKENSNIEIEYFVHGALCVCFSGNCYLSSYYHDASGNRGRCKQLCRLPYTLKLGDKTIKKGYLLSAKDFNLINRLSDLKKAGVNVLKIEGRAKRPEYVGAVVKEYRKALNGIEFNSQNLDLAFNRGFSNGYFDGNDKIISNIQNHIGIEIGKVLSVKLGNKFNEVLISSNYEIAPKSTIKIFDNDVEKNTISLYDIKKIGNNYLFTTTQKVEKGNLVRLILDYKKEADILSFNRKTPLNFDLDISVNRPIKATFNGVEVVGDILEDAKSRPLSKEEIIENFSKNGLYIPNITFKNFDKVFIQKSKLNEFRRAFYGKIEEYIFSNHSKNLSKIKLDKQTLDSSFNVPNSVSIYSPNEYILSDINKFVLDSKKQGKSPYLDLPNFATEVDIKILKNIVEKTGVGIVVNNLYALSFDAEKIIGAQLNVYNNYSARYFNKPCFSAESNVGTKCRASLMTLIHCPIKSHVGGDCKNCQYKDGFTYHFDDGKKMQLIRKKVSNCIFYLI